MRDATVVEQLVSYANTAKTLEWYMKLLQPAKPNRRQRIKWVIAQTATGAEQCSISLMEALVSRPEGNQVIHSLLSSPPGKFLELGVDALLTDVR